MSYITLPSESVVGIAPNPPPSTGTFGTSHSQYSTRRSQEYHLFISQWQLHIAAACTTFFSHTRIFFDHTAPFFIAQKKPLQRYEHTLVYLQGPSNRLCHLASSPHLKVKKPSFMLRRNATHGAIFLRFRLRTGLGSARELHPRSVIAFIQLTNRTIVPLTCQVICTNIVRTHAVTNDHSAWQ